MSIVAGVNCLTVVITGGFTVVPCLRRTSLLNNVFCNLLFVVGENIFPMLTAWWLSMQAPPRRQSMNSLTSKREDQ